MNKPLEWQELWDAMKANPAEWIPTTEAMYWEMLGAVPPRAQNRSAFLVGEADHHNADGWAVYSCFKRAGEAFYAKNMTYKQFNIEVSI
jgi:hypothetical protein